MIQYQADDNLFIQCIAVEWTQRTEHEEGAALRRNLPKILDLPTSPADRTGLVQDQIAHIFYHWVLYDEMNSYQEPCQQSWTAYLSQPLNLPPGEEFVRQWLPPGLTSFSLPALEGPGFDLSWRLDLSKQDDALLIEFWRNWQQSRYPTLKWGEVALLSGQWAQVSILGKSILDGKDYSGQFTMNVGYVQRFTPTLFGESPPRALTRFSRGRRRMEPGEC